MGSSSLKLKASLLKDPIHFLALGFGSGLSPKAPGTAGTLMAIPLYLCFNHFHGSSILQ